MDSELSEHWNAAYDREDDGFSWFQARSEPSLAALEAAAVEPRASVIDIGGGASPLVDGLLERAHRDVAVLDLSERALAAARERLGERASGVTWIVADVMEWKPRRQWDLWHDRAMLHFLVRPGEAERYAEKLSTTLAPGGVAVIGVFGPKGPERCSGLPVRRYSAGQLVALLGAEFELLAAREEEHVTPGGSAQSFTWVTARRRTG